MTTGAVPQQVREASVPGAPAAALQVHLPYRRGLPPLRPYLRAVWARRAFLAELSRSDLRAQQAGTALGRLWTVVNPMLLACVFFVLVTVLRDGSPDAAFFARLVGALFVFTFVQQSLQQGITAVVGSGQLILNTAFPRVLLPLAAVRTALARLAPAAAVYAVIHVACGLPLDPAQLWLVPVLGAVVVLAAGLTLAVAAAQVYVRDLRNVLGYGLRAWLYVSPILWSASAGPARYAALLQLNPLAPSFAAMSDALVDGRAPAAADVALSAAWAAAALVAGAWLFISREREFAVRL